MNKDLDLDLRNEFIKVSKESGIRINESVSTDKILVDYLTVRFKTIVPKPRNVKFAPELFVQLQFHPKKEVIQKIALLAKAGSDINHFQSSRLLQTNFHDHLRNEWNIFHFHLSDRIDKKTSFVKRTNQLLFAYITDNHIVFLGIDSHRKGIFGDSKWIKILHDDFPYMIEEFKQYDISDITPKVDSKERQILWDKGYTLAMTQIDDTIYINPGLGRATTGHSSEVITTANSIQRWVKKIDQQIDENINELSSILKINKENLYFQLKLDDKLYLIEKTTSKEILAFPKILISKSELELKISK